MTRNRSCGATSRVLALLLPAAVVTALWAAPAGAQTPFGGQARQVSTVPPGRPTAAPTPAPAQSPGPRPAVTAAANAAAPVPVPEAPALPVPGSVIRQAEQQLEGQFPPMARAGVGGQIQEVWNDSEPRDGVHTFRRCEDCVYKVRLREFMVTTIILPEDAEIVSADLGDTTGFQVKVKSANVLAVRPATYGIDTDLNVYTRNGAVYPVYLRAESFNSKNVPDLVAKIVGREKPAPIEGPETAIGSDAAKAGDERQGKEGETKADGKAVTAVEGLTNPKPPAGDFVRAIPFDPSKLHGWKDYKLWGNDELRPETVFRDDQFTYIQYGRKWDALELPTAYVVIDGIDELVNSRVQGTTFIVESVNPLISLKSGQKFMCIQYMGEKP